MLVCTIKLNKSISSSEPLILTIIGFKKCIELLGFENAGVNEIGIFIWECYEPSLQRIDQVTGGQNFTLLR